MLVLMMVPEFELLMSYSQEESGLKLLLIQRLEEPEVELLMSYSQEKSGLEWLLIQRLTKPEMELLMNQLQEESGLDLLLKGFLEGLRDRLGMVFGGLEGLGKVESGALGDLQGLVTLGLAVV